MKYDFDFAVWRSCIEFEKPDVSFIPPMERRRLTGVERAALSVAWQVRSNRELPVVFASRWGEIGVTAKLMKQFHADGEMSPAGFSASVHNSAPGAFSLLTKNHASYTAISARARSLESGLIEAFSMRREVIFVYAEEATPDLYKGEFENEQSACAVAIRMIPNEKNGRFNVRFRNANEAVASFDELMDVLAARVLTFAAGNFELVREV